MQADAEAPSACSSVSLRLRVSTGREPCVVLPRLVIQTLSYLLSCHEATTGGADTRHAETTQHWVERPLSETLQLLFGLECAAAANLIESGAVYLEQRRATAITAPVPPGSHLRVHLQPKQHAVPEKLTIVACAEEYVVCSKPSGVPVHPTVDSLQQNLLWAAAAQLRMRLLPTSRLDEGTSGLVLRARHAMEAAALCARGGRPNVSPQTALTLVTLPQVLLARTERLQARFNAQLRRREVTKEYVALVLLYPPPQSLQSPSSLQQPLQPPSLQQPLRPGGQACAASPPPTLPAPSAPPAPPALPAALREGSMLVHWMERRPRAPMRLSATSIEGACLRSGAWPLSSGLASPRPTKPAPLPPCHLTPPWCPTMAGWARCESEVLHVRCMQAQRRDLRSGGGGESGGGGGGGGGGAGGGESDAEAAAPSALIVAEVRGCHLPMPPAPVAYPCHLSPPQVTLRLHTGRTHQLRAQVSHPQPAPSPPPARPQPAPSPPPARPQPAARRAYGRQPMTSMPRHDKPKTAQSACKHATPSLSSLQLSFVGHPVLGDEMYGSPPLRELRELCRLDTAPEGPLPSHPVAWLPERPFALHSWKLRFAGRAAEPDAEDPGASIVVVGSGSAGSDGGDGGSCRQVEVTHAYEVQPPWTVY
jgi:23S rRNA-/tRNA-specific pseudouridylate synthase